MDYEIANPDPAGTIASLGSLGYSLEAAVADLIDNSIAAGAKNVDVIFTWNGSDSWAAIVDDGKGMSEDGLVTAMTIAARGAGADRTNSDLGRFGLGLKTASFSQCRMLIVRTRPDPTSCFTRAWDLEAVAASGQWRLFRQADEATEAVLEKLLPSERTGTAVVWRQLHRFAPASTGSPTATQKQFYAEVEQVERHIAMVFCRYLGGKRLKITVNGDRIHPWDPFMADHPAIQRLAAEEIPFDGHTIRVRPFILPSPRILSEAEGRLAAGSKGWLDHQGFYIFRRDRLILAGDWLRIRGFRRDERYNLARIAIDIPAEADSLWSIDVRKSSALPPVSLRRHLERIGQAVREKASSSLNHRGKIAAREHGASFLYAWNIGRSEGSISCKINKSHPLVAKVLKEGADRKDAAALLRLIEETVPISALRIIHQADTVDDPVPFGGAASDEVQHVAQRIYQALVEEGRSPAEARRRIALMPPFNELEGFWQS